MLQSRHEIPDFERQINHDHNDYVTYLSDPKLIKENDGNLGSSLTEGIADAKSDNELFGIVARRKEELRYKPTEAEQVKIEAVLVDSARKSLIQDFSVLTENELVALVQRLLQVLDFISDENKLDLSKTVVEPAKALPPIGLKSGDKDMVSDRYLICGPIKFGSSGAGFHLSIWRTPNDENGKARYQAEIVTEFDFA